MFQTRRWHLKTGRVASGSSFKSKDSRRGGGVNISILAVNWGRVGGDDDDEDEVSLLMGDKLGVGLLGGNCEGGTASAACDDDDGPQDAF
jgi:hypothetical protein